MKRALSFVLVIVIVASTTGCAERRRASEEFNKLSRAFEAKMEKGETTREQEQSYVRATSRLAYEFDRSIRGNKKADRARKEAEAIINGFRPNDPLRIDAEEIISRYRSEDE
jgi:hypothetical protein